MVVSLGLAGLPAAVMPMGTDIIGNANGNAVDVVATDVSADGSVHRPRNADGSPASVEYRRMPASICFTGNFPTSQGQVGACRTGEYEGALSVTCAAGQVALDPVFRQSWVNDPDGSIRDVSGWELVNEGDCLTGVDLAPLAEAEFARLVIVPSPITVQPPDGWTLVNVETITYTTPAPQRFATTLLGIPVTIEAIPEAYRWDYGDGSGPVTTTDPGAPFPDQSVSHVYTEEAVATITLGTTWAGRFQITGTDTWTPIAGTARTTSTAPPLTIHEARARLVTEPLD